MTMLTPMRHSSKNRDEMNANCNSQEMIEKALNILILFTLMRFRGENHYQEVNGGGKTITQNLEERSIVT